MYQSQQIMPLQARIEDYDSADSDDSVVLSSFVNRKNKTNVATKRSPAKPPRANIAEEYINSTRGSRVTFADQINKAALKRLSRVSEYSDSGASSSSEDENLPKQTSKIDNEFRVRLDGKAPVNISLSGDMESRTLQLVPAENGMTDLVIGGRHITHSHMDPTAKQNESTVLDGRSDSGYSSWTASSHNSAFLASLGKAPPSVADEFPMDPVIEYVPARPQRDPISNIGENQRRADIQKDYLTCHARVVVSSNKSRSRRQEYPDYNRTHERYISARRTEDEERRDKIDGNCSNPACTTCSPGTDTAQRRQRPSSSRESSSVISSRSRRSNSTSRPAVCNSPTPLEPFAAALPSPSYVHPLYLQHESHQPISTQSQRGARSGHTSVTRAADDHHDLRTPQRIMDARRQWQEAEHERSSEEGRRRIAQRGAQAYPWYIQPRNPFALTEQHYHMYYSSRFARPGLGTTTLPTPDPSPQSEPFHRTREREKQRQSTVARPPSVPHRQNRISSQGLPQIFESWSDLSEYETDEDFEINRGRRPRALEPPPMSAVPTENRGRLPTNDVSKATSLVDRSFSRRSRNVTGVNASPVGENATHKNEAKERKIKSTGNVKKESVVIVQGSKEGAGKGKENACVKSSREGSMTMTPTQQDGQRRHLAAELGFRQGDSRATGAREGEGRTTLLQEKASLPAEGMSSPQSGCEVSSTATKRNFDQERHCPATKNHQATPILPVSTPQTTTMTGKSGSRHDGAYSQTSPSRASARTTESNSDPKDRKGPIFNQKSIATHHQDIQQMSKDPEHELVLLPKAPSSSTPHDSALDRPGSVFIPSASEDSRISTDESVELSSAESANESDEASDECEVHVQDALNSAMNVVRNLLLRELLDHALPEAADGLPAASTSTPGSVGSSASSILASSSVNSQAHQRSKRSREGGRDPGDGNGDNSDDEDRPKKKAGGGLPDRLPHRRLKCPFYQRQPDRYNKAACRGSGFVDMAKLKDHIKRVHTQPLRCSRCWTEMECEEAYSDHLQQENICDRRPEPQEDRIRPQLLKRLDFKKVPYSNARNVEEKWRILFKVLFPEDSNTPSPYEDQGMSPQLERALCEALEEELTRELAAVIEPIMTRIKSCIPAIIENCCQRLRSESPSSDDEVVFTPPISSRTGSSNSDSEAPTKQARQLTDSPVSPSSVSSIVASSATRSPAGAHQEQHLHCPVSSTDHVNTIDPQHIFPATAYGHGIYLPKEHNIDSYIQHSYNMSPTSSTSKQPSEPYANFAAPVGILQSTAGNKATSISDTERSAPLPCEFGEYRTRWDFLHILDFPESESHWALANDGWNNPNMVCAETSEGQQGSDDPQKQPLHRELDSFL
ncbi:hypothetical protein HBI56_208600 [Parastagonospora nodorum]|nr:hypothetical protein HBH51_207460 [Parastagonospora nodorum]KAH3961173.1 hypothetical protein HBH52_231940 [Parastagonospora nodorum]KAH4058783.1 hypothetical protein HBH50_231270 [Parastagonospora nodorum]KAH4078879.1 hypothetical protein HBH48_224740 [Parastagonospora nodorum]KAH4401216.1 hypothetical protein HBH92_228770 [Parastagonospora nodorum]